MQHKLPPVPVRILLALIIVIGGYYAFRSFQRNDEGALTASGSIEATTVNVSPELAGKVKEVLAEEGQSVKTGDPLLSIDDSLLTAQRDVAASAVNTANAAVQTAQNALNTAKAQYQITLEAALAQGKSSRLQDWFSDPDLFEQPGWYFTRQEQIQAAQSQAETAQKALEDAQTNLISVSKSSEEANFLKAEARLLNARLAYLVAQDVNNRAQNSATANVPVGAYNRTHCGTNQGYFTDSARMTNLIHKCTGDEHLADAGRALYEQAREELENAQKEYNGLLTTEAADVVLQARADVSVTEERFYSALDFLRSLQTGDQSTAVTAAQGGVDQALSAVEQAQKAVEQAQANLNLIDTQLTKLKINSPMNGMILTRNVEPGEFVQPGAVALTLADLNNITITVYVPEDRYGEISLGQQAEVRVDSFPNLTFTGEVIHIADEAEFTPRNVQTVEGRSSTVYAIRLRVTDSEGKLKIGMPADVSFR